MMSPEQERGTGPSVFWRRLTSWWNDYWFRPTAPTNLAVCRIVVLAYLYWECFLDGRAGFVVLLAMEPDVVYLPHGLIQFLPRLSPEAMMILVRVLKVAVIASIVGFMTPIATVVTAVSAFYVLSQLSMFGKVLYLTLPMIMAPAIFAVSRSGDALSIDSLIRARWKLWPFGRRVDAQSGRYRWPVQAGCLFVVILFFSAGVAKLLNGGLDWAFSETLANTLAGNERAAGCRIDLSPMIPALNVWLLNHPAYLKAIQLFWLLLELSAPLALIRGKARHVAAILLLLSLSPSILIGRLPWSYIVILAFLVPWDRFRVPFLGRSTVASP